MQSVFEFVIILLLVFANGLFAMTEFALVSASKHRLEERAQAGSTGARTALQLTESPNLFLSTVQIGITLVGILAGAFGGATLAEDLRVWLNNWPLLAPYSAALALGAVVAVTTYLSLVLGELVPKRLALNDAEGVASLSAPPLKVISWIAGPLVHFLSISTELVLKIAHVTPAPEPLVTEQEIKRMIVEGADAGVLEMTQTDIMERVFQLGERKAGAFITPRTEIVWLDVKDSAKEIRQKLTASRHSRFPVAAGSLENIIGVVHVKDLIPQGLSHQRLNLRAVLRPPVFVPAGIPVLKMLEHFRKAKTSMLFLLDEYGGLAGLATLNDIMEAIAGDVGLEDGATEPSMIKREDGSWLLDGGLEIDKFKELLQVPQLPEEGKYRTLAGFVLTSLGRIPVSGNHFELRDWRVEVVDMDGPRVDKVMVKLQAAQ